MGIFARIENGVVAELIATEHDIATMFHHGLHWVEAGDTEGVAPGWRHDGERFQPPAVAAPQSSADAPAENPAPTQG
jgi:hypothetical protein